MAALLWDKAPRRCVINIFLLDLNPELAAQYQTNIHVPKMCLETAQMLSTAARANQVEWNIDNVDPLYKSAYFNHPCTKWARESVDNFLWLYEHGHYLLREYLYRYRRLHKCRHVFDHLAPYALRMYRQSGYNAPRTFAQAMPVQYKQDDAVAAYRAYYRAEKMPGQRYTGRPIPYWYYE